MSSNTNKFDNKLKDLADSHGPHVPEHVWEKIIDAKKRKWSGWLLNYRWLLLLTMLSGIVVSGYYINELPATGTPSATMHEIAMDQKENVVTYVSLTGNEKEKKKVFHGDTGLNSITASVSMMSKQNDFSVSTKPSHNSKVILHNKNENDKNVLLALTGSPGGTEINNETPEVIRNENEEDESEKNNIKPFEEALLIDPANADVEHSRVDPIADAKEKAAAGRLDVINETPKQLFSISVFISPEFAVRNLENKNAIQSTAYLDSRKEGEERSSARSAGVRLAFAFNEHFFMRAGITHSVIGEKAILRYDKEVSSVGVDTVLKGYIVSPEGVPEPYYVYDSITLVQVIPYDVAINNKYSFTDVTLSIGYAKKLKKLDLLITAGISLNMTTTAQGSVLSTDSTKLIALGDKTKTFVKSKTGMGISTSIGIAYHITKKWDLLLEPNYQRRLSSITKENYPLNQKYTTVGITAGLSYKF